MSDHGHDATNDGSAATSFSVSFALLPRAKRDAIRSVYAFCRFTDDIVDEGRDVELQKKVLDAWTGALTDSMRGVHTDPALDHFVHVMNAFGIPRELPFELIDGMHMDLSVNRYETFEDLQRYCYLVASTVGLMCSRIFGYRDETSLLYARKLGIAMQLTNIIRDVSADADRGRIYLPLEDMRRFGYSVDELLNHEYTPSFYNLMRFQADRAWRHFREADALLPRADFRAFVAARIMGAVYRRVLRKIERRQFRVFDTRVRLNGFSKLLIGLAEFLRRSAPAESRRHPGINTDG